MPESLNKRAAIHQGSRITVQRGPATTRTEPVAIEQRPAGTLIKHDQKIAECSLHDR